jgi:protein-disulfide isomerase
VAVTVSRGGRRRGRWLVLGLLCLGTVTLFYGLINLSTQKPDRQRVSIAGAAEAQEVFGGVRQKADRLGSPDAPVTMEIFDDLQCGNCRQQFLSTIPTLVETYVRPGDVQLQYRHYSFSPRTEELGFYGAEAAADQDYAWPYIYLFFRNQGKAERVGIDDDFLIAIAGSIGELDVPAWRDYLKDEGQTGGPIADRLAAYEKLGFDLRIRAQPAAIVSGPGGTRTLQDSPTLDRITAAIDAVS